MSCWEDIPIIFKKHDKASFRAKSSGFSSFRTLISRILSRTGLQVSLVFASKSDHPSFSPHNMSPTKQVTGLCTLILPFSTWQMPKLAKKYRIFFFHRRHKRRSKPLPHLRTMRKLSLNGHIRVSVTELRTSYIICYRTIFYSTRNNTDWKSFCLNNNIIGNHSQTNNPYNNLAHHKKEHHMKVIRQLERSSANQMAKRWDSSTVLKGRRTTFYADVKSHI